MAWVAIGTIGGLALGGIGAATGGGGGGGLSPASSAWSTMQGYRQYGDDQLELNQLYNPQFLGLGADSMYQLLFGGGAGGAGGQQQQVWTNARTGERRYTPPPSSPGAGNTVTMNGRTFTLPANLGRGARGNQAGAGDWIASWETTPGGESSPGMLDLYDAASERMTGTRMASARQVREGMRALDPGQASLYDRLLGTANRELALGRTLSPDQVYRTTNPINADYAGRGMMFAPGRTLAAGMGLYGAGEDAYARRLDLATNTAQLGSQLYTQPAMNFNNGALDFLSSQQPLAYQRGYDPYNPTASSLAASSASEACPAASARARASRSTSPRVASTA